MPCLFARRFATTLLLGAILLLAASPKAEARDLDAHLSQAGLDFIAKELPGLLPKSYTHTGFTNQLVNCPDLAGGNTDLKVSNVKIAFKVSSVTLKSSSGMLTGTLKVSATGSADVEVTKPYACLGNPLKCVVTFDVTDGSATVTLKPQMVSGKLKVTGSNVSLGLTKNNVDIKVSSCGFASTLLNLVMPLLEGYIVDFARKKLEEMVNKELPPLVEQSLQSITQLSGQAAGFSVTATLLSVGTSSSGVQAGLGLTLKATSQPACTLGAPPMIATPGTAPAVSWQGEHLAAVIPIETTTKALVAAWQGGYLCLSNDQLQQLGLPSAAPALLGILLGMSSVDKLNIVVAEAPGVSYVTGSSPRVMLKLTKTNLILDGLTATQQPTKVTITLTLEADTELRIDPVSRAVLLDIKQVTVSDVQVGATDSQGLNLNATLVQALIETAVVPLITAQLANMKLLPTVLHKTGGVFDSFYLYVTRSTTTSKHVTLFARAFAKVASDTKAPDTSLETVPAALVQPQLFRFVANGTDNATPADLLRFQWRVNGAAWSPLDFARDRHVQLADGSYQVEVRAVDLHNNSDATPASTNFVVDGIAPTLQLTQTPPPKLQANQLTIAFVTSDDRSPASTIEVKGAAKHADPQSGQETQFFDGAFIAGATSLELQNLTNGDYTVSLVAKDQAGNLSTPVEVSFTIEGQAQGIPGPQPGQPAQDPTAPQPNDPGASGDDPEGNVAGGCTLAGSSAGGTAPAGWPLLLLLAMLGFVRLRRR